MAVWEGSGQLVRDRKTKDFDNYLFPVAATLFANAQKLFFGCG